MLRLSNKERVEQQRLTAAELRGLAVGATVKDGKDHVWLKIGGTRIGGRAHGMWVSLGAFNGSLAEPMIVDAPDPAEHIAAACGPVHLCSMHVYLDR